MGSAWHRGNRPSLRGWRPSVRYSICRAACRNTQFQNAASSSRLFSEQAISRAREKGRRTGIPTALWQLRLVRGWYRVRETLRCRAVKPWHPHRNHRRSQGERDDRTPLSLQSAEAGDRRSVSHPELGRATPDSNRRSNKIERSQLRRIATTTAAASWEDLQFATVSARRACPATRPRLS